MRCFHPYLGHPCGKCPACLLNRQRQFAFRLEEERKDAQFLFWLTLTYDDTNLPRDGDGHPIFCKSHCRQFFEWLRLKYRKRCKFKHFLVSEFGDQFQRPHYHCILFVYTMANLAEQFKLRQSILADLSAAWPYGFCYNKDWHGRVFDYLTKYCCKPELAGAKVYDKPFTMISQGIGIGWLKRQNNLDYRAETLDFTAVFDGKKMIIPRYYQDKVAPSRVPGLMSKDRDKFDKLSEDEQRRRRVNRVKKKVRNDLIERESNEKRELAKIEYNRTHKITLDDYWNNEQSKINQSELQFANRIKQRTNKDIY